MSQKPRLISQAESSILVFMRLPTKNADVPAKNMNTGAQKWVIKRVRNNGTVVVSRFVGSK